MGIWVVALSRAFLLELHAGLWPLQGLLDERFGVLGLLVLMKLVDFLAEMVWKLILSLSAVPILLFLVERVQFDGRLESPHVEVVLLELMPDGELGRIQACSRKSGDLFDRSAMSSLQVDPAVVSAFAPHARLFSLHPSLVSNSSCGVQGVGGMNSCWSMHGAVMHDKSFGVHANSCGALGTGIRVICMQLEFKGEQRRRV